MQQLLHALPSSWCLRVSVVSQAPCRHYVAAGELFLLILIMSLVGDEHWGWFKACSAPVTTLLTDYCVLAIANYTWLKCWCIHQLGHTGKMLKTPRCAKCMSPKKEYTVRPVAEPC